ncbi:tape measure protein [Fructobacillus cardui]|uniref:Phage-related protein n=1 Tax=Fructobacillus cardui TaxID=2893170 RepID=A0ABN9YSJ9_9LACO|nr:Phage-related protein [Fructobacillus cardui]
MAKITNEMATKLSLDTTSASKTLKEFTDDVKKSTNEWKVQEAQMRSAGDQLGASKVKYEGLTTAVEKQTTKVESLKQALANTNTSTEKGQKLQGMLTAELAKAERQLNSYNGQLDRAEQSYKYQSSGMAKLNDDIKHNTELTEANVKQLKAEGKEHEANKVKLEGLAKNRENLNGILKIQQAELDKLASSGDKNSEAYKKQELRVAQMKAKIAEANSEIRTMNSHGIKINTSSLDKVNERLAKMNERVNKSGHLFGKVFGANIVSAAFINGLASSKAHLVDALKAGTDFNKEQQVMGATWNTLTGSAEKGQDMVNSINSMSKAFGQSNDVVNELQQQFYHVFNQKEPTEKLTGSMLTLADTLGMNNEEVERLGLNFTHMMSSSRLQLGDFNMISDQLPMYGEKLLEYEKEVQHNSNLTMEQLRKQMSDGKISAQDATNVINELGDKYKDASENMMSTFTGMQRRIKAQSHVLAGSITRPLLETKNPLFKAVSDWVADDRTVKLFDNFGQQLSKTFNTITSAFGKSFKSKDFDEFANNTMVKLTNGVQRFGDYVAKHSDDIIKLAQGIKAVGGSALSTGGMMLKILVPMLMKAGELATKHKTTFKILAGSIFGIVAAIKGMMVVSKIAVAWSNLSTIMKDSLIVTKVADGFKKLRESTMLATASQYAFDSALWASGIPEIIIAVTALVAGFALLYKNNKKFKTFVDNTIGSIVKVAKKTIDFFKKDWKQIGLFILNPVVGTFSLLYKHNNKFKNNVNKLSQSVKKSFETIGNEVSKTFEPLVKNSKKGFDEAKKQFTAFAGFSKKMFGKLLESSNKQISKIGKFVSKAFSPLANKSKKKFDDTLKHVNSFVNSSKKVLGSLPKKIGKFFNPLVKNSKRVFDDTLKKTSSFVNNFKKMFGGVGKTIGKSLSNVGKSIGKEFGSSMKDVKGIFKDTVKESRGSFGDINKDVTNTTKGIKNKFKEVKKTLSDIGKWINKNLGKVFKDIKKEFNNQMKPIKKYLSELGKEFKKAFSGINKFLKQHKKEIQTVGKVISTVFKAILVVALIPLGAAFAGVFATIRIAISVLIAAIKPMAKTIANIFITVIGVLSGVVKVITNSMKLVYHLFTGNFKAVGKDVGKIVSGYIKIFTSFFGGVLRQIGIFFSGIWDMTKAGFKTFVNLLKPFSSFFIDIWKGIQSFFKPVIKWFEDIISDTIKSISNIWNSVWNGISSFFGNIWKGMSKFISNTINGMHDVIKGVLDKIGSTWNGMWSGLSDFFGGIWKDIKGFAQDGINGVLKIINGGIDAIDSVWKFFTGHETSIHHLKPVKFERGGVVETRMSMVNDGKGENWKELIQLPNGQLKMSNKRDHILPLPVGTRIYNGDQTKQIMKAAGVEKYANGGIVGSVVSAAKGVGEWVGDKYEMVTKFLKDPLKNVTDLIIKGTKGMYDGLHSFGDMAHGVFDNLYNPIAEWFKKGLEAIKSSLGRNAPSGTGVQRWRDQVIDALKENGMSTESWAVNKILKQISTESSGNEKAVQGGYTDINMKTGDLAKGLMQTISATFNRYAFPGHKNIFNGYDNLLAAIAYIKNRYGMNMSGIGEGHGYANGGLVSRHQIAQIAEGNKPEMIIPLDSMKSARGFELLGKTAVAMAARDGQSSQNTTDNSEVVGKLDQMITLLSMILGVNKEQLSAGSQNNGLKAIYEQMARDNTIRNYQSI